MRTQTNKPLASDNDDNERRLSHKTASEQHVDHSTDPGDANGFWKKLKHHFF